MKHNFDQLENRFTYAERKGHQSWLDFVREHVGIEGKTVADIGCGGGIYTTLFAENGAKHVTGVDQSEKMLTAAREKNSGGNIDYVHAPSDDLSVLQRGTIDVLLARALIHHLDTLRPTFEAFHRTLRAENGVAIIQDRTPADYFLPGSPTHLRGYLFEKFPFLREVEEKRRFTDEQVQHALKEAGFTEVSAHHLWEVRDMYADVEELRHDLRTRRGRSILHQLDDVQIEALIAHVEKSIGDMTEEIIEKDRWTIWIARV
ncbi:class I SAM-dependent methyltransferase [Shouchella lonarensis]|uniref:2-polyprenyl-3-methyl-5-hydroxy-6-metoxy-1,4-benzoquinol methylase n=1 Tax=Shouchella lonarensis TaxID=1464122 RepID=A0A1G6NA22_9BACI|nr:class I SAM-dependent methyltransferase [Shouchella lonarensis]SDC64710.1 2-polyprenyl-3-methyl-5-hydroxy-6-metoxy-1,4-benzoquinol methylase [Shouchella lonarensis]